MAILFPPIIESKIPAQEDFLQIYYTPNPMVTTFETLAIKIKTISTNTEIIVDYVDVISREENYFMYAPRVPLNQGEFYKIQVAYAESSTQDLTNLYWSNIGIFKWTARILGKDDYHEVSAEIDKDFTITSYYTLQDKTEPIYSYELSVINSNLNIEIYKCNELYVDLDPTIAKNKLLIKKQLPIDLPQGGYIINLLITTINGYKQEGASIWCEVMPVPANEQEKFTATVSFDKESLSCLIRADKRAAGAQIARLENNQSIILGALNSEGEFKDTTILPGEYIYSIRWNYRDGGEYYSIIEYTYQKLNPILIDFEDMYLNDKDHLLCLRFNPKVSSFKENVLESKQDTIGGRYPFFFRNGNTKYKEFSINGLISYHMDNNETFLNRGHNSNTTQRQSTNDNSTDSNFIPTTQLTGKNIYEEREFKLAVLEWLNNGRPKLFRSPTEGAYLVRLMNISLSPEDQLGRMLHSFQATAYEIDECTLENLRKYDCLYEEE